MFLQGLLQVILLGVNKMLLNHLKSFLISRSNPITLDGVHQEKFISHSCLELLNSTIKELNEPFGLSFFDISDLRISNKIVGLCCTSIGCGGSCRPNRRYDLSGGSQDPQRQS
jgi:hypothetical protein